MIGSYFGGQFDAYRRVLAELPALMRSPYKAPVRLAHDASFRAHNKMALLSAAAMVFVWRSALDHEATFAAELLSKATQVYLYGSQVLTGWLVYYFMHSYALDKGITRQVWWKFICVVTFNYAVIIVIAVLVQRLASSFIPATSEPTAGDLLAIPSLFAYLASLVYYIPAVARFWGEGYVFMAFRMMTANAIASVVIFGVILLLYGLIGPAVFAPLEIFTNPRATGSWKNKATRSAPCAAAGHPTPA